MGFPILVRWHLYIESCPVVCLASTTMLTRNIATASHKYSMGRTSRQRKCHFHENFIIGCIGSLTIFSAVSDENIVKMTTYPLKYYRIASINSLWSNSDAIWRRRSGSTLAMTSQITSLTIVYSAVYSGAYQRKHQSSASLAFVRGIHRWPVNSPHKWPVTRKMFPFDNVIMGPQDYKILIITSIPLGTWWYSYHQERIKFDWRRASPESAFLFNISAAWMWKLNGVFNSFITSLFIHSKR